jgi:hypothetical protein
MLRLLIAGRNAEHLRFCVQRGTASTVFVSEDGGVGEDRRFARTIVDKLKVSLKNERGQRHLLRAGTANLEVTAAVKIRRAMFGTEV